MTKPSISPMPADFTPSIVQDSVQIYWEGTIQGRQFSLGFSKKDPDAAAKTRRAVWEIHEHARLERHDLTRYASKERHADHPISVPLVKLVDTNPS